jgi:outer membrane protein assembly factor BamD
MNSNLRTRRLLSRIFYLALLGGFLIQTSSCGFIGGLFKGKGTQELEQTPESLMSEGINAYQRKKYSTAIEAFQKLKDRFPYNQYAIVAELKLADSYYLNKDYALAAAAYKEFEKLHPANEIIPYIIYQLGLCYFNEMPTIDRDQSFAHQAAGEFERLIKTYPQSEYAPQAKEKLVIAQKNLVHHEYYIGEFYFKDKKYDAALARFEGILKRFPGVPYPPMMDKNIQICKDHLAKIQTTQNKSQ